MSNPLTNSQPLIGLFSAFGYTCCFASVMTASTGDFVTATKAFALGLIAFAVGAFVVSNGN